MKHNLKITFILLAMFILTQFIGLYVVNYYSPVKIIEGEIQNVTEPKILPFGMESPKVEKESDYYNFFSSIIISFVIAILLLTFLTKFKAEFILKLWFFIVVMIALGISLKTILPDIKYITFISLIIVLPLAYIKIYQRNFLVHNLTELFIYPGIAAVFVPIVISIYDMWAVWHSGIMQKMAKYQINELKIFSGFFIPYASKKIKMQIQKIKESKKKLDKKIKVNVAILGGGDIIFPIITSGVMLKTLGFIPAIFVIIGATIGLSYLFSFAKKKKFYPAMPFITAGIFLGIIIGYLFDKFI